MTRISRRTRHSLPGKTTHRPDTTWRGNGNGGTVGFWLVKIVNHLIGGLLKRRHHEVVENVVVEPHLADGTPLLVGAGLRLGKQEIVSAQQGDEHVKLPCRRLRRMAVCRPLELVLARTQGGYGCLKAVIGAGSARRADKRTPRPRKPPIQILTPQGDGTSVIRRGWRSARTGCGFLEGSRRPDVVHVQANYRPGRRLGFGMKQEDARN